MDCLCITIGLTSLNTLIMHTIYPTNMLFESFRLIPTLKSFCCKCISTKTAYFIIFEQIRTQAKCSIILYAIFQLIAVFTKPSIIESTHISIYECLRESMISGLKWAFLKISSSYLIAFIRMTM